MNFLLKWMTVSIIMAVLYALAFGLYKLVLLHNPYISLAMTFIACGFLIAFFTENLDN